MKIQLYDSNKKEVNLGDWVKVSNTFSRKSHSPFAFIVKVQLKEGKLIPFQNFAYDQIEKVDGPPENMTPNLEGYYFLRGATETIEEAEERAYAMSYVLFQKVNQEFFKIIE